MSKWNGKTLLKREIDMIIDSHASLKGWGAHCGMQTTRGAWSKREATLHINCLELLAVTLAVQSFVKNKSILLRIDNTTAVAYINHLKGTVSRELVSLTKDLWMWCPERNTWQLSTSPGSRTPLQMQNHDLRWTGQTGNCPQWYSGNFWSVGSEPFCDSSVNSVSMLLQLVASSICRGNRCIPPGVDPHQGVRQPTLESGRQDTYSSTDVKSQHSAGSTSVEIPTTLVHILVDYPRLITVTEIMVNRDNSLLPQLAHLRERYRSQQLSEEATELMLSSWRTKTNKSYDLLFAKWHCWCSEWGSDPFHGPVAQVANFLAQLYKEGYKYNSVNSYRSTISSVHEKVDGYTVSQHPWFVGLVFQARPPLPRYSVILIL